MVNEGWLNTTLSEMRRLINDMTASNEMLNTRVALLEALLTESDSIPAGGEAND